MPRTPRARDLVLDAAQRRLLEHGPGGLVLDQVAADAGVSKGGLLYHFPSKEALVSGLVERMLSGFDAVQEALHDADADPGGAWTRAYVRSTVSKSGEPADDSARLMAGLLAGFGGDAARLGEVHARFQAWRTRIEREDGVDPTSVTIVRLAADGLWLSALLGLPSMPKALARKVMARLDEMTREG